MDQPEHPGLLAAVIADIEDDAPRLVYSDWLEENGDPDRAQFIRAQCALARLSPAEPTAAQHRVQMGELAAALRGRSLAGKLPRGVGFDDRLDPDPDDYHPNYHRGFPFFAKEPYGKERLGARAAQAFRDALPELIETTTMRGLRCDGFLPHLPLILGSPAAAHLSALSCWRMTETDVRAPVIHSLLSSPASRRLRWLYTNYLSPEEVTALAGANLDRMERFELLPGTPDPVALERLLAADWFGRLRRIRLGLMEDNARLAVTGLAGLPDLHTLESMNLPGEALAAFGQAGLFAALGRLSLHALPLRGRGAEVFSRARMPRLAVLGLTAGELRNDDMKVLAASPLFAGLHDLALSTNELGDRGIAALAASPCAATLRILRLGDNSFGKKGLQTLARPGAFPRIATLDLKSSVKRRATVADVTTFLAGLSIPGLRQLDLSGWPVQDAGARAIAGNPAFANLTVLNLGYSQIEAAGVKALLTSPHLRNLVKLDLVYCPARDNLEALADPTVLPRLRECWLPSGVSDKVKERLRSARETTFI